MIVVADEADEMIKDARATVAAARSQIDSLSTNLDERFARDLKSFLELESKQLEIRMGRMDSRLSRTINLSSRFRDEAIKKQAAELQQLRKNALKVMRYHQKLKKLKNEDLFNYIDINADDVIDEREFLSFFEKADKNIREVRVTDAAVNDDDVEEEKDAGAVEDAAEKGDDAISLAKPTAKRRRLDDVLEHIDLPAEGLSTLFLALADNGEGNISREGFLRLNRVYMKVVKETAMTNGISIKDSRTLRRLDVNEVVEVMEGPLREDTVEVMRVHAKALKDGSEGWITIAGNQGTVFLRNGGDHFKVVKETILTDWFELEKKDVPRKIKTTTRKLKEGEILEVLTWPKKEEKSGLMRMKAKMKSDGAVGWVTATGNQGTVFLEVV